MHINKQNKYIIKDSNKSAIKTFNSNAISWFTGKDEVIIAISLPGNRSSGLFDNIYSFDGNKFNLINKNVRLRGQKSGLYSVKSYFSDGLFRKTIVTSVKSGKSQELDWDDTIVGIAGDNLLYINSESTGFLSSKDVLKVKNLTNGNVTPLLEKGGNEKLQILKSGSQVVLKVFSADKLQTESKMHGHYINLKTKYNDLPARYISLNTLTEVDGVSDAFRIVPLYGGFSNMGGGYTKETYITYNLTRLNIEQYGKRSHRRGYSPVF